MNKNKRYAPTPGIAQVLVEVRRFGSVITSIKSMVAEHKAMVKVIYGDPDDLINKPGAIRDVAMLKESKSWITHSITAAFSAIGTAILGGLGYWIFHR
jgi:hypothetical protein